MATIITTITDTYQSGFSKVRPFSNRYYDDETSRGKHGHRSQDNVGIVSEHPRITKNEENTKQIYYICVNNCPRTQEIIV